MKSKEMKYVVVCDEDDHGVRSIVFPKDLTHAEVAFRFRRMERVISAGFCYLKDEDGKWYTYGESESLGVKSHQNDYMVLNQDFFGD